MIEKLTHRITPIQLTGYIIFCISFIALFFTSRLEPGFSALFGHIFSQNISNITVRNLVLLMLNIGLTVIISAGFKDGDERIKAIRDYVTRRTLRIAIGLAVMMGLFLKINNNQLVYAAVIQGYYLIVFQVCSYRDTTIVYMNEEQLKAHNKKSAKSLRIYLVVLSLFSGAMPGILMVYHRSDLMPLVILVSIGMFGSLHTVYTHWKS